MCYISNSNILICILLSLSGLTGCSSDQEIELPEHIRDLEKLTVLPVDADPLFDISIEQNVTFENELGRLIGPFRGFEVDSQGRAYISDSNKHGVHVFNADGSYVTLLGGEGSGPGEFRGVPFVRLFSNLLYVCDSRMARCTVYDLETQELLEIFQIRPPDRSQIEQRSEHQYYGGGYSRIKRDGNFLFSIAPTLMATPNSPLYNLDKERYAHFYIMDSNGQFLTDKLFELREREFITAFVANQHRYNASISPGFLAIPLLRFSEEGHIFTAWSKYFLIREYSQDGHYLGALYVPFKRKNLTRADATQAVNESFYNGEYYQGWVQNIELPEIWPAINNFTIDEENRMWVSTIVDNFEVLEWWVISSDGNLHARFNWPRTRDIEAVKNGHIYTYETDPQGEPIFSSYRFEMN